VAKGICGLGVLFLCGACESNQLPPPPLTLDLGAATSATFGGDGSLTVTRNGMPLLATPPGMGLLSRAFDANSPDGWHDPAQTTAYTFVPLDPRTVTVESPSPGVLHVTTQADGSPTVLVRATLASDAGFYTGMGERYSHVSASGAIIPMHMLIDAQYESGTNDAHIPVPLLVSSNGYGVFFESHQAGAFDVAATDASTVMATFEGTDASVWFFFDPDPLEVVADYVNHVGLPRPLPRWALGPMYWRNHWASDQAVLADAVELRNLHIPTTTMWIDDPWQTAYNTFVPNPAQFPDPPVLMGEMAALGYRVMLWSTPYLEKPGTGPDDGARDLYAQAVTEPGVFVRLQDGTPLAAPGNDSSAQYGMIDFTTSVGRDYWSNLASAPVSLGASGFKLDYGEDVIAEFFNARLGIVYADGETDRTARTYPLGYHAAYHQALDAARNDGVVIVRASSYGGASIADMIWPGDLDNDFSHYGDEGSNGTLLVGGLPSVVVAAQTLSVSGFPSFGSDTGGYRNGTPTKEALLRWAEHTSLSVIMQLYGGGDGSHAPWAYDDETVSLYTGLAALHTELEPYLSSIVHVAETQGVPTIRPLPLAFPADAMAAAFADDEYMLGPDLLMAPVVEEGVTSRQVHFPPGAWESFWTNVITVGPTEVEESAPLGTPLLFARVGALLPMLAADIDTLTGATAPAVVTANQRPTFEARGWPSGPATATFDDGTWIAITDVPQGVGVTFVPGVLARAIVVTLDLTSRTGDTAPLTHVLIGDSDIPALASEADVRASGTSAYVLNGNTIVLLLTASAVAWIE
jgi:alpha-glucosidase (family GH31 glycosyl hydrolase)